jgi:hypothetical protein
MALKIGVKEMIDKQHIDKLVKEYDQKFTSLNGIPVTSIRLTVEDWFELKQIIKERGTHENQ